MLRYSRRRISEQLQTSKVDEKEKQTDRRPSGPLNFARHRDAQARVREFVRDGKKVTFAERQRVIERGQMGETKSSGHSRIRPEKPNKNE